MKLHNTQFVSFHFSFLYQWCSNEKNCNVAVPSVNRVDVAQYLHVFLRNILWQYDTGDTARTFRIIACTHPPRNTKRILSIALIRFYLGCNIVAFLSIRHTLDFKQISIQIFVFCILIVNRAYLQGLGALPAYLIKILKWGLYHNRPVFWWNFT